MRMFAPLPYRRADWLAARAAHASRHNLRLAAAALVAFFLVFCGLLVASGAWRLLAAGLPLDTRLPDTHRPLEIDGGPIPDMLAAALVLGLFLGYAMNLAHEIAHPRLAGAREAERVVDAPVVAVIESVDRGRGRSERVNPYRLAYLSVSPAGNRARTLVLTGDDVTLVTTIAAGIARIAASDAQATLVLDLDVERAPASSHYDVRSEPGFTDALVGVRLWREVARAVGANEGLSIEVVPGGAPRREVQGRAATPEFEEFLLEHDLCVVIAPGARAFQRACALFPSPLTLLCVQQEVTTLSTLSAWRVNLTISAVRLHGLVLWRGKTQRINRDYRDS